MNKILVTILLVSLFSGCQDNAVEPPFDCAQSDLGFTATVANTVCGLNTGTIDIAAIGGEPPYSYSINEGAPQTSSQFTELAAGEYVVTVSDNLNCAAESLFSVGNGSSITVSAAVINSDCGAANGSIIVTASDGVAPYQYQLDNGVPQASAEFLVDAGIYIITVTDVSGCESTYSQVVKSTTSFAADIEPIIANSCAVIGCHDGSNSSLPNYNNFSEIEGSAAMIRERTQSGNMPKTGSLTQEEIALIACWVDDGAIDN
jgi:hypothetical protein